MYIYINNMWIKVLEVVLTHATPFLFIEIEIYTETKKFSNTLQIRIFITEIHVEITQTE